MKLLYSIVCLTDENKAVNGMVTASFSNSGQICLCCSRILVHESLFDKFVAAMVEKTKQLVQGDPLNPEVKKK